MYKPGLSFFSFFFLTLLGWFWIHREHTGWEIIQAKQSPLAPASPCPSYHQHSFTNRLFTLAALLLLSLPSLPHLPDYQLLLERASAEVSLIFTDIHFYHIYHFNLTLALLFNSHLLSLKTIEVPTQLPIMPSILSAPLCLYSSSIFLNLHPVPPLQIEYSFFPL